MADNNPFLFVRLPLDEIRHGQVLDVTPNRRHGSAHGATIADDDQFGKCLQLSSGPGAYVEITRFRLLPLLQDPKLTFMVWIQPDPGGPGNFDMTLLNAGFGPDMQRLKVQLVRKGPPTSFSFTVLAPHPGRPNGEKFTAETTQPVDKWFHFAFVWVPKGGSCDMFLNGLPLTNSPKTAGDPPQKIYGAESFQAFLGQPLFQCKLAHLRIYTRELTQPEIAQEIDRDRARQRKPGLIECSLLDPVDRSRMFLYPSSAPRAEKMTLALKPLRRGLRLARPQSDKPPPTPNNCHFELQFRPGVLTLSTGESLAVTSDPPAAWVGAKESRQMGPLKYISVCIRCNSGKHLAENVQLKMVLDSLMADQRFGWRWTRIDLRYHIDDDQKNRLSGRIPQWLLLWPREQPGPPALILFSEHWTQDPGTALRVSSGNTLLQGRLVCANAQAMMKHQMWGPEWGIKYPNAPYRIVASLPLGYTPWPREDLRYTGRARWFSADSPEPEWSSDLCILSHGTLGIDAEKLTGNVYHKVARIEVSLDGVSYASDESLLRAGET